ncbi:hypothetical protein CYY_002415 [Polysphondylium violaceum]|uniref:NlpC/P60 domain-containing protein n=1 Tax=Polysphondylium violaceum TaxID=133409 RepID=A0A8J4PZ51_9MYCE|nr:hypothetical protein CYY_002415 [Polysphondylium violaceum]
MKTNILILLIIIGITNGAFGSSFKDSLNKHFNLTTQPESLCQYASITAKNYANCQSNECHILDSISLISHSFKKAGLKGISHSVRGLYDPKVMFTATTDSTATSGSGSGSGNSDGDSTTSRHHHSSETSTTDSTSSDFTGNSGTDSGSGTSSTRQSTTIGNSGTGITGTGTGSGSASASSGSGSGADRLIDPFGGGIAITNNYCDPTNIHGCQPGDLFFYCLSGANTCPSHVAMYVGNGIIAECNSSDCTLRKPSIEHCKY